jgi:hypothetical protein
MKNDIYELKSKVHDLGFSLLGLSSLFLQENREVQLDTENFYGIGVLLKSLSDDMRKLEDSLVDFIESP